MDTRIMEIAQRIRGLREILEIEQAEMAEKTHVSLAQYQQYESGEKDFGFTFLYDCANILGVDVVELLSGEPPKLSFYSIVRSGKGLPMHRRQGFSYHHLAYNMKNKMIEPFLVTAPYFEAEQSAPIALSTHKGQEMDYVLKGSLKVQLGDHIEVLGEGDSVYYDSGHPHGMIATGGRDCQFLAMVVKPADEDEGEK
ncbi:XRE family transcriptional regulator [Oscillospiraceae bacterium MB08-C2-2]|nr:XRE family transcriptional regulator [Oscillospiraceae bacterium MB08-C2-2]